MCKIMAIVATPRRTTGSQRLHLLHLDSSPLGIDSVSRGLTAALVAQLRERAAISASTYRDLAAHPLRHLDGDLLQALRPAAGASPSRSETVRAELALTEEVLGEFLAADTLVVGAPMYNFGVPSQLKAWLDRLAQAGRTFRYTERGPEGLAGGKKVVVVSTRGGFYHGTPMEAAVDHQEAYLRAFFGFLGITDVEMVRAEGLNTGPDAKKRAIEAARRRIEELVGSLKA